VRLQRTTYVTKFHPGCKWSRAAEYVWSANENALYYSINNCVCFIFRNSESNWPFDYRILWLSTNVSNAKGTEYGKITEVNKTNSLTYTWMPYKPHLHTISRVIPTNLTYTLYPVSFWCFLLRKWAACWPICCLSYCGTPTRYTGIRQDCNKV